MTRQLHDQMPFPGGRTNVNFYSEVHISKMLLESGACNLRLPGGESHDSCQLFREICTEEYVQGRFATKKTATHSNLCTQPPLKKMTLQRTERVGGRI